MKAHEPTWTKKQFNDFILTLKGKPRLAAVREFIDTYGEPPSVYATESDLPRTPIWQ